MGRLLSGSTDLFALLQRRSRTCLAILCLALAIVACRQPAPAAPEPWQADGTRRMAERLALFATQTRQDPHAFMNRDKAALLERLELPEEPRARFRSGMTLAQELLRAGRTGDAVSLLGELGEIPGLPTESLAARRKLLAIAYLRRGEEENCLEHPTPDACLLPIRGSGVHHRQESSRAALRELSALLDDDPGDLEARWLLNVAAMTVGDHPGGVPPERLIPPSAFASDDDPGRFVDVAARAGVDAAGLAGGSALEDFDGDGNLDLMVSSWGIDDPLRYFQNRGDGTFEERTREAGLAGLTGGLNLVHADYDNDGWSDVLVLRGGWLVRAGRQPNSLLRNLGGGPGSVRFEDVTEDAGLLTFHPTQTAAWGDYDNDGWLDLYVGNESLPGNPHRCQLFRNGGSSGAPVTFTDVAGDAGVDAGGYVKGVVWGDVDGDGWLDLYLSRLLEPNLLFLNPGASGESGFREVAAAAGVAEPTHSFPVWFWDYDNDGRLDLFVSGYASDYQSAGAAPVAAGYLGLPFDVAAPRLYRNAGSGGALRFEDVTITAGLDHPLLAMGANFGDLDNDGWLDLYLGTGAPSFATIVPNRMFRNDRGRRFLDVTTSGGFGHLQKGHGVSFGDVDRDGDQDVYAVLGGAYSGDVYRNALFENPGHGNRWVILRLEGTAANRSAIGARLRLTVVEPDGRRAVYANVGTGGSFGSSSLQQEIGLGRATRIETLEIRWPGSGTVQVFRDLPPDRGVTIRESEVPAGEREPLLAGQGAAHEER